MTCYSGEQENGVNNNMNDWQQKLKEGKEKMKRKCFEIALKYCPTNISYIKIRKNLTGRSYRDHLEVPKPSTRKALYIFLHECAHNVLEHYKHSKKVFEQEFEAEQWAHNIMRKEGLSVPRDMTSRAKSYINEKIGRAMKRGLKKEINPKIKKWIK